MRTLAHKLVLSVVSLAMVGAASTAFAESQPYLLPPAGQRPVPRVGFYSYFNGYGEAVTSVMYGTPASRMGLEPGDVILSVNGFRLSYNGAWYQAMARAAQQGYATLAIRDWRTGRVAYRNLDLGGPVITPKGPPPGGRPRCGW